MIYQKMKKCFLFLLLFILMLTTANGMSFPPDYQPEGLFAEINFDYGRTFKTNKTIMCLEAFIFALPSPVVSFNVGYLFMFSPNLYVCDLYGTTGLTWFPVKFMSLNFSMGLGTSFLLFFNHFPYMLETRINFDIPVTKNHYITAGAGLQHRNTIRLFNYLKWDNYYGIHNTWFFQIGYRYKMTRTPE